MSPSPPAHLPSSVTQGTSLYPSHRHFLATISVGLEPTTYAAASIPEWRLALEQEIHALKKNGTWILSLLPSVNALLAASGFTGSCIKLTGRLNTSKRFWWFLGIHRKRGSISPRPSHPLRKWSPFTRYVYGCC